MKKLISVISAMALCAAITTMPVSAAIDGVKLQMDEIGNAMGYTIKGYYGSGEGDLKEVTPTVTESGEYFFQGVQGDPNYSVFYTEIYNQNGEKVQDKELTYVGDLAYGDPDQIIDIEAPCTYDDYTIYSMIQAGVDPSEYIAYINGEAPSGDAYQPDTTQATGESTTQQTTPPPVVEDIVEQVTSGVAVRVSSSVETAAIEKAASFTVILEDKNGVQTSYGVRGFKKEFQLVEALEPGTYSVSYSPLGAGIAEVSGTSTLTVAESGVSYLDVTVVPTCTLTVNKTGSGATEYYIDGVNKMYNTSVNPIAIFPGSQYRVIDNSNSNAFDIVIPSNATACVLDLGTATGVPTNDKAYEDATLDKTASDDNPFNIPVTADAGEVYSKHNSPIILIAIVVAAVASGVIYKRKTK